MILGHIPNEDVKKAKGGHAKEKNLENGTVMPYTHYKSTESMNYTDKCGQIFDGNFMYSSVMVEMLKQQ